MSVESRRKKLRKIWQSKEWKEASSLFLSANPVCSWCGKPSQVAHHPYRDSYGKPEYISLYISGCIPLCIRCHFALHKGLSLCPSCRIHYTFGALCRYCDPEYAKRKEDALKRKEERNKKAREYRKKKYREYVSRRNGGTSQER
jgi:predicted amidophosphoribosyltransferase